MLTLNSQHAMSVIQLATSQGCFGRAQDGCRFWAQHADFEQLKKQFLHVVCVKKVDSI